MDLGSFGTGEILSWHVSWIREVVRDMDLGLIGLHMKDVLCRLALGKAVSLASVRPQMLQIRKCFIQCLAQDPLVTNRCYHQGRNTSEFGHHLSGAPS